MGLVQEGAGHPVRRGDAGWPRQSLRSVGRLAAMHLLGCVGAAAVVRATVSPLAAIQRTDCMIGFLERRLLFRPTSYDRECAEPPAEIRTGAAWLSLSPNIMIH